MKCVWFVYSKVKKGIPKLLKTVGCLQSTAKIVQTKCCFYLKSNNKT